MRRMVTAAFALLLATNAIAQTNSAPVKGMASTVGLYVYPKNDQTGTQQLTDESQCYSNAKTQTGYDPNATTKAAKPDDKKNGDKPVAKGAVRGAVISGATGGDAAAGARRGAMLGSIKEKRQEKQQTEQEQKQADAAKTASQQSLDGFKRSMSACLDARGYSVK
jgi:opacity protein-like surface antigen